MTDARQEIVARFYADRPLAHETMFAHRRPNVTPSFHRMMIEDWHSTAKHVLDLVFRGGAKSTISEEAIVLMACFREFKNCLVIGENFDRAAARLHAIRREIETNELLLKLFGDLRGDWWADDKLVLSDGSAIIALGKGQSLRGIKHEDMRPDLVFTDDLENRIDCATPEARKKTIDWFTLDLLPACDPSARIRVDATPLHPQSLPMVLKSDPEWITHTFPLYYLDDEGEPASSWPDRFPMSLVRRIEKGFRDRGQLQGFRQEYMCQAEAPETKAFQTAMFRIAPQVRTWQAVYSMTDPARTTHAKAATTGHAVWSWIGAKLVVWDAWARRIMPDEIVGSLFDTDTKWKPVEIGFEEDGLNEWGLQLIRTEQVKRGQVIPFRGMKAPPGKIDFIRGLQPYFKAGEVEFATRLPDLESQLLGFPNGDIDAPNALAFAPRMRPGAPIYDNFGARHVLEDLQPQAGSPVWLCLNATRSAVSGLAVQALDGRLRVFADWIREGAPADIVADLYQLAKLEFGSNVKVTCGASHFDRYNNIGLVQALAKVPVQVRNGVTPDRGQLVLRQMLEVRKHGAESVLVSDQAAWTLRAFVGGYARSLTKTGVLSQLAEDNAYRLLMEGLESFVGLMELGSTEADSSASFNATTADGRGYRSMMGGPVVARELKTGASY